MALRYGVIDTSTGDAHAVNTASTSTVVLEGETPPGARVDADEVEPEPDGVPGLGDQGAIERGGGHYVGFGNEWDWLRGVTPHRARGDRPEAAHDDAEPMGEGVVHPRIEDPEPEVRLSSTRLRMFGVDYEQLRESGTAVTQDFPTHLPTGAAGRAYKISYIESDETGRFILDASSSVHYTWVPSAKIYTGSYQGVTEEGDPGADVSKVPMVALYKDPYVLRLPASVGGWLMLLARVRFRQSDLPIEGETNADIVRAARRAEAGKSGNSIGDIVAWHCTSQTFRDGVLSGPFLVVDSLDAIVAVDGTTLRTWLGAPTAMVLGEPDSPAIYVYYNIHRGYLRATDGTLSGFDAVDHPDSSFLTDLAARFDTMTFDGGGDRFRSGVGVKRVATGVLAEALAWSPGIELVDPWRDTEAWEGTIKEPVRYFYDDGGPGYVPMRDAVAEAVEAAAAADPTVRANYLDRISPRSSDPGALDTADGWRL